MTSTQLYIQTAAIVISMFVAVFAGIFVNNKAMDTINGRIGDMNARFDDTNKRIDDTNRRIDDLRIDFHHRFAEIHQDLHDIRGMLQEALRARA